MQPGCDNLDLYPESIQRGHRRNYTTFLPFYNLTSKNHSEGVDTEGGSRLYGLIKLQT